MSFSRLTILISNPLHDKRNTAELPYKTMSVQQQPECPLRENPGNCSSPLEKRAEVTKAKRAPKQTGEKNSTEKKGGMYPRVKVQTFHKSKDTSKEPRSPWRNFVAYHTRGTTRKFNQGASRST